MTTLSILVLALSGCVAASDAESSMQDALIAKEVYVQFHPRDGYLLVKEYAVGLDGRYAAQAREQVAKLGKLVATADYCSSRYGFPGFTSFEERVFHDRGFVTIECHLLTRERNLKSAMRAVYGSVFDRPAEITITPKEVGLHFTGSDIEIRDNNSEGFFGKDDRRVLFWRNGVRDQEIVFAIGDAESRGWESIAPHLEADVASPEVPEAEIDAWKRAGQASTR